MKKFDSINVIPFIDIMLVLLAVVLTSASFVSNNQLEITLPESNYTEGPELKNNLRISLDESARLYIDGQPKTWEDLENLAKTDMTRTDVILEIDQLVKFDAFVKIADLIKPADIHSVTILTTQDSESNAEVTDSSFLDK